MKISDSFRSRLTASRVRSLRHSEAYHQARMRPAPGCLRLDSPELPPGLLRVWAGQFFESSAGRQQVKYPTGFLTSLTTLAPPPVNHPADLG